MTPERWQEVKEILDRVVECDPASRAAYIRDRCGDDEELRREVESLLASDTKTGSLLDNPLMDTRTGVSASSIAGTALLPQNDSFGPYVPVRVLGEGGMGTVYLAQQEHPIRREVALKVVKLGMDSRQVLERFDIERQALALMDYPNVARVLDAGTSERGRPYFVMEYVDGVSITQYCDENELSTRERLQLFIPVCNALQHAHKKGIIHRDVKPSNVLVTEIDGKPVPKVIDFGVARAIEQRSAQCDAFTLSGQLIGTPEYMSPEQASLDNRDIDTGTDVYSLGVVLYELLVGMLPLDIKSLRKIAFVEVLRAIRETPVPKPTARITQMGSAGEGVALQRSTSLAQLKRELAGDLDLIVMKAIDKDRHLRYASASEFAADIDRYLKCEPVVAGPPDRRYRIHKFIRRHRRYIAAAVTILGCLVLGLAVSTSMFFKAESARREAEHQSGIARHESYVADLYAADLHLRSNEIAEARRRLLSCPKDFRGWEWRHLFLKCDFSLATLYTLGDSDYQNQRASLAFSADDNKIYSSTQHTLYSWDTVTFLPIARWSGFGSILALAPHAEKIVSKTATTGVAETDHTLRLYEPFSHRLLAVLAGHGDDVTAAAFSPDGGYLVSGDKLGVLFLWDAVSGKTVRNLKQGSKAVSTVAFSPDGMRIAATFRDDTLHLYDLATGDLVTLGKQGNIAKHGSISMGAPTAVAFSPDSKRVAAASGKTLRVWETTSRRLQVAVSDFDWPIWSLAFNPEGTRILTGTDAGVVEIRDGESGKHVADLLGHQGAVQSIAFHSGKILTADGSNVRVWDPSSSDGVKTLPVRGEGVTSVAFAPNGRLLAAESQHSINVWDTASGKALLVLKPERLPVLTGQTIAFSPDSTYLASRSAGRTVTIWDLISGAPVRVMKAGEKLGPDTTRGMGIHVTSLEFSPDGSRLATGSSDGTLRFWEVATGRMLSRIVASDAVNALAFSPDGRRIVTGTGDPWGQEPLHAPAVRVWDVASGNLLVATDQQSDRSTTMGTFGDLGRASKVVYSRDGRRIACLQNSSAGPMIWDANSGKRLVQLKGPKVHFGFARSIAFHPDGHRLFASWGNQVQIWDADSGEPLLLLYGHSDSISSIAFSMDGSRLASASVDGTVKIWDTRSAYDPEAEELVQSRFSELHFAADVTESLRNDPSLNASLRQKALLLVQQVGEQNPTGHIKAAWEAAKAPGSSRGLYESALSRARMACELAPWNWEAFNSQGAVQYRLGAYRESLSSLLHAAELRARPSVANLAFQALTYRGLGQREKARLAFVEAKRVIETLETMMDADLVALVKEAESAVSAAGK